MAATVEFHTGVPDVVDFACRLLRKAYQRGATVLCLAPMARLEALDRALWTFAEREFVPHVRLDHAAPALRVRTPIWLAEALPASGAGREVLLSLGAEPAPSEVGEDLRLIEVVGAGADEVERGRALWRHYKAAGRAIVHHPYGAGREA
jgi:DNA polymerase-3 subunit chi